MSWEFKKFNACRERGFIRLQWHESASDLDLRYRHYALANGNKIALQAIIDHIILNADTMRKKFVVRLSFTHKSDCGDALYYSEPHTELDLESALAYAEWQATVVFRLIEGGEWIHYHKKRNRKFS